MWADRTDSSIASTATPRAVAEPTETPRTVLMIPRLDWLLRPADSKPPNRRLDSNLGI
ncbi:hypothetical protein NY08_3150 [Rhodococcus sp. B7740]|nr:hypothetical protein NY08_3150 [Rhodococcus sp. B7740]